jgi:hypothetical protein
MQQRDHSEDLDVDWKRILKLNPEKEGGKMWIGFVWLRMGISGRLF